MIDSSDMLESSELIPTFFPDLSNLVNEYKPFLGREPYQSMEFELQSSIGEKERKHLIELMMGLPGEEGIKLFKKSANLSHIFDNAANHKALDAIYVGPNRSGIDEKSEVERLWARIFMENIHNAMAVRNRLRIIKTEFLTYVRESVARGAPAINVLSVAAGSSRGILETISQFHGQDRKRINARFIDSSPSAKSDGELLADKLGVTSQTDFMTTDAYKAHVYLKDGFAPDFVEIVGLMDYLPDRLAVRLLATLKERMSEGGEVIYSNIIPNDEQTFIHKIVGWQNMVYRDENGITALAEEAGFDSQKVSIVREPLGIYNLVSVQK